MQKVMLEVSQHMNSSLTTELQEQNQYGTGTDRRTDQWERKEDTEIWPYSHSHLTFEKGVKNIHWENKGMKTP